MKDCKWIRALGAAYPKLHMHTEGYLKLYRTKRTADEKEKGDKAMGSEYVHHPLYPTDEPLCPMGRFVHIQLPAGNSHFPHFHVLVGVVSLNTPLAFCT